MPVLFLIGRSGSVPQLSISNTPFSPRIHFCEFKIQPSQTQGRKHFGELRRLARPSGLAPYGSRRRRQSENAGNGCCAESCKRRRRGRVALGLEQAYVQTLRDAAAQTRPARPAPFRLRGTSFLLTWNWSFTSRQLPDGTVEPSTEAKLWTTFLAWKKLPGGS